jgi:hypothetical protein
MIPAMPEPPGQDLPDRRFGWWDGHAGFLRERIDGRVGQ